MKRILYPLPILLGVIIHPAFVWIYFFWALYAAICEIKKAHRARPKTKPIKVYIDYEK